MFSLSAVRCLRVFVRQAASCAGDGEGDACAGVTRAAHSALPAHVMAAVMDPARSELDVLKVGHLL